MSSPPQAFARRARGWRSDERCGIFATRPPPRLMRPGVHTRSGFSTVTPRLVVADVPAQLAFLRTVFGATGTAVDGRPAEMRIGDSSLLVSPTGERAAFPAFLHVYVDDADVAHRRALAAGAVELEAPFDTPYGDRRAMVRDPFGNVWQIAHVVDRGDAS